MKQRLVPVCGGDKPGLRQENKEVVVMAKGEHEKDGWRKMKVAGAWGLMVIL